MNDLGLSLAWLAGQVALVLGPALVLQAFTSRREPSSDAWAATLALAMVTALSVSAFAPGSGRHDPPPKSIATPVRAHEGAVSTVSTPGETGPEVGPDPSRAAGTAGRVPSSLWLAWDRFGRKAAAPAARFRRWGRPLAVVALTGMGVGLLRLVLGLWAVHLCRRRGRAVDDPAMTGLLHILQCSMGYRPPVAMREVAGLTTPATAGWRRPVVLLPDDWRSWDAAECRAVLAHELAHIIRGDYAAVLLARIAVILNSYHPMVCMMAGRLQLQQELAADALGARFAGGRARYLVALSRLALRQDGRSLSWPARAFLPARGTLIRRITMLRDETKVGTVDRPMSGARRLLTALGLLGLTIAVATIHGPVRGDETDPPPSRPGEIEISGAERSPQAAAPREAETPFEPLYVPDNMTGMVAFRPAAAFRRAGMGPLLPLVREGLDECVAELSKGLNVDTSRPGFRKLGCEEIEWIASGIGFGSAKNAEKETLHSFYLSGLTVRAVAPLDWLAFLRQWRFEFDEVREGGIVYHKVKGPMAVYIGLKPCMYLPDDRTLVFTDEETIRKSVGRGRAAAPAYLTGPDWERVRRGLLAVAVSNQDGTFAKQYDLGRPDDAVVLSLFRGVDRWVFGVDNADAIALHAAAACGSRDVGEAIARMTRSLVELGRKSLDLAGPAVPAVEAHDRARRMIDGLLANLRVEPSDRAVNLRTEGFGTLADFASIIQAEADEAKTRHRAEGDGSNVSR